jgi:hypothetical protein
LRGGVFRFRRSTIVFRSTNEILANTFAVFDTTRKAMHSVAIGLSHCLAIIPNRCFHVFVNAFSALKATAKTVRIASIVKIGRLLEKLCRDSEVDWNSLPDLPASAGAS